MKIGGAGTEEGEEVDDEFDEDTISITDEMLAAIDKNGNGINHDDKEEDEKSIKSRSSTLSSKGSKKGKDKVKYGIFNHEMLHLLIE